MRTTDRTRKQVIRDQETLKEIVTRKIVEQRSQGKPSLLFNDIHEVIIEVLFPKGIPNHIRISVSQNSDGYYEITIENILHKSKRFISIKKKSTRKQLATKLETLRDKL